MSVIKALNISGSRYVIVGGFAAVMHGTNRFTSDIDVVVDLAPEPARNAVQAVVDAGFDCRAPVDPLLFADSNERARWVRDKKLRVFSFFDPNMPTFTLDFFVEPPMEFEGLFARSEVIKLAGEVIRICSVDDLIAMKQQAARPQDLLDVQALTILKEKS